MKRLRRISPEFKVLQPQWLLADEIRQQLLKAAGLYENADVISEPKIRNYHPIHD